MPVRSPILRPAIACSALSLASLLVVPLPCQAEDEVTDTALFQQVVESVARARSPRRQLETPALLANSTAIADRSSVAEFFSIALNLSQLSGGSPSQDAPTSASATVTTYALYMAVTGQSENADGAFNGAEYLKDISFTLGYEDQDDDQRDLTYGGKFELDRVISQMLGERSACPGQEKSKAEIVKGLTLPTAAIAAMSSLPTAENLSTEQRRSNLRSWLRAQSDVGRNALGIRTSAAHELGALAEAAQAEAEGCSGAIQFLYKDLDNGMDELEAKLVLEYGYGDSTVALNGSFEHRDVADGANSSGASAALEIRHRFGLDAEAAGRVPVEFSIGGSAKWLSHMKDQYMGNATIKIPIMEGVSLPISVSVANRDELVDETFVRGLVGFSVDTSLLAGLLD